MPKRSLRLAALALPSVLALTACASESSTRVAVTGTDDACTPAETELTAGKITFDFTNRAGDVSELYLLRADESVVAEVENVTTGTRRSLTASLVTGEYFLVCKPGQKGDGFRTGLKVTGSGGTAVAEADRTVPIGAKDYAFEVPAGLQIAEGETIRFEFANGGKADHEMEILGSDGQPLGEVAAIKPGAKGEVTITFPEKGRYKMVCALANTDGTPHTALGMEIPLEAAARVAAESRRSVRRSVARLGDRCPHRRS
jgi:plastocyanin